MAKLSKTDSRRMYSWWWDSHISPNNSKWLQNNLTDMDAKVKVMIKLIEEDADSFARRAEMYYKKRPELMKMVEEFYRAYRALAERYDNATGVIRHAQRTMTEAFPNQDPMMFSDDSPVGNDPRTPGTITPNGEFTDEYDSVAKRKGLRLLNDTFGLVEKVRKGLNFDEEEEKEQVMQGNENNVVKDKKLSKSDEVSELEQIRKLKEAIAKLEAEKEAGFAQYQKSLDKLSQFESEILQTKEDFRVFSDRATKAENEVLFLKESLIKLESEKNTKLQEYQKSLETISDLQNVLNTSKENTKKLDERASGAETEAQSLKGEMVKLTLEKDEALNQYMKSLEMISNLENKLRNTEEDSRNLKERADNAENEIKLLGKTVSELTQEYNDLSLKYQQCLETISVLEEKLRISVEEAKRLNVEVNNGVSKLKGVEENCLLLERSNQLHHSELESLMLKMETQTQELTEKQKELGRLWACAEEERLRFVEAETAFHTLHTKTQEKLQFMASEINKRAQLLKVEETRNEILENEFLKVKEKNEISASSMKDMENEISCLKESKGTLEEEVEIRINERNVMQQEIYLLKEEINNLKMKHASVLDKVKELQNENFKLKETYDKESSEKAALLKKMVILEQLIEKNSVLENSLSDLNAELESVRGKILALEQSCQSLLEEKSALIDEKDSRVIQLEETNKNLEKLSENNTILENSLSDAHYQIEALKAKSKIFEDSCELLVNEKGGLISELENTRISLKHLGKIYGELESRCLILEKEKETTVQKVEKLLMSINVERQKHAAQAQVSEKRDIEMSLLHAKCQSRKRDLDHAMDNSIENEIEKFVLCITAQELVESNRSILDMNKALESKLREENNNSKPLLTQIEHLNRMVIDMKGTCEVLEGEKLEISEEKRSLMDNFRVLEEKNNILEEENYVLYNEVLALDNFSLIFHSFADEKFMESREVGENFNKLHHMYAALVGKLNLTEAKLEESKTENLQLQEKLQKSEDELKDFAAIKNQLGNEIENGEQMSRQMELELHELNNERKIREEKLKFELQRKMDEIGELENEVASVYGKFQFSMISQLLYEQKYHEIKESMVHENTDLRSKLDASTRQLELLQSESGRYRKNFRPPSEITEVEKDIMLDQVSDNSSYGYSKREESVNNISQIVDSWKTTDPDDATKKSNFKRVTSVRKQKDELIHSDSLSEFSVVDKLDISKRFTEPLQEGGNKRKVLERLDSDVQKLANLQITVQDLKKKLEVTEKDKRGKAVIECLALKRQLEEADVAIIKLFGSNGKLKKNIDDSKYFPEGKSSFDLEGDGNVRRKVSELARRMSEKIGRLQLEVQKLQFVLLKLDDDNKEGKAKVSEKRRRVVLRDYFYGGGGKSERRKKAQFCGCVYNLVKISGMYNVSKYFRTQNKARGIRNG